MDTGKSSALQKFFFSFGEPGVKFLALNGYGSMRNLIIALSGVYDCGKTTTIRLVRDKIINELGGVIIAARFNGTGDINLVIEVDGFRIGIESQGDPSGRQEGSIAHFISIHCDIIICTCRSYGNTKRFIEGHVTHDIVVLKKDRASKKMERQENEKSRDAIIRHIQKRLNELSTVPA